MTHFVHILTRITRYFCDSIARSCVNFLGFEGLANSGVFGRDIPQYFITANMSWERTVNSGEGFVLRSVLRVFRLYFCDVFLCYIFVICFCIMSLGYVFVLSFCDMFLCHISVFYFCVMFLWYIFNVFIICSWVIFLYYVLYYFLVLFFVLCFLYYVFQVLFKISSSCCKDIF